MSKIIATVLAILAAVALALTPTVASADTGKDRAVSRLLAYFADCDPGAAWQHASEAQKARARQAMTSTYGPMYTAWTPADLRHAYQGETGWTRYQLADVPVEYVAADGRNVRLAPPSGWCYGDMGTPA